MGGASEWKTTKRQLLTANTNQTKTDESNHVTLASARRGQLAPGRVRFVLIGLIRVRREQLLFVRVFSPSLVTSQALRALTNPYRNNDNASEKT